MFEQGTNAVDGKRGHKQTGRQAGRQASRKGGSMDNQLVPKFGVLK